MKYKVSFINLVTKALAESVNVETMESIVNQLVHRYDLHQRTGFPQSIPIPNRDAAKQICDDIVELKILPHFISLLINIHYNGLMGRKINIPYLREIIKELYDYGFIYDQINKIFVEDPSVRRTRNWGVLRNDVEYTFAFLRMDIVGNTKLVKEYPEDIIASTYRDFQKIVTTSIEKRNGRIWNWEGDGGLIAFYFANKNQLSTLAGMEIIHEIFIYNQMHCRLKSPLGVRLAIHNGFCEYSDDIEDINKNETIKQVIAIESKHTQPNTLTISPSVFTALDSELAKHFNTIDAERGSKYHNYQLRWEQ